MKRLLTFVVILIAVGVVYSLVARERSILRGAEERVRRAEATARDALDRARHSSQSSAPAATSVPLQFEPGATLSATPFEPAPVFAVMDEVEPVNGLESLRQQYVQQQAVKALLMQAEELQSALDTTNSEIRELDAQARLKVVSETLAGIAEEFNGTQAAPLAERMLELYRNPAPPDSEATEAAGAAAVPEPEEPSAGAEIGF